jgi:isocitrate dehydrogenase
MAKVKVEGTVVELDGDEMTRVIWQLIKDTMIHPHLDVALDYYDLGIESRDNDRDRGCDSPRHLLEVINTPR